MSAAPVGAEVAFAFCSTSDPKRLTTGPRGRWACREDRWPATAVIGSGSGAHRTAPVPPRPPALRAATRHLDPRPLPTSGSHGPPDRPSQGLFVLTGSWGSKRCTNHRPASMNAVGSLIMLATVPNKRKPAIGRQGHILSRAVQGRGGGNWRRSSGSGNPAAQAPAHLGGSCWALQTCKRRPSSASASLRHIEEESEREVEPSRHGLTRRACAWRRIRGPHAYTMLGLPGVTSRHEAWSLSTFRPPSPSAGPGL